MRPMGVHRGNPTLRTAIGTALRRRLYASLRPHAGDEPAAEPGGRRWSRAFFDELRARLLPRMALVESLDDAELRYFGRPGVSLWSLSTARALVLAYDYHDTRAELLERARRWRVCLRTHTAPGLASRHWGHPVYGARVDPLNGELDVVWAVPGDWMALADPDPPARTIDRPAHWTELAAAS